MIAFRSFDVDRCIFFLIVVLVVFSMMARSNYAFEFSGRSDVREIAFFVYGRELIYCTLACVAFYFSLRSKKISIAACIVALYVIALLFRDAWMSQHGNILYGVRVVVIFFASYAIFKVLSKLGDPGRALELSVKCLISFSLIASVYQVFNFPPYFGATLLGSRANGLYFNPIIFSMAVASCAVYLYCARAKWLFLWLGICFFICLLSGGRAGLLVVAFVFLASIIPSGVSRAMHLVPVVFIPLVFILISSSEISGRQGTEAAFEDGRLKTWSRALEGNFKQVDNFLFGTGLGDGTNASFRSVDVRAEAVSDSAFVMIARSFGVLGLICYLGLFYLTYSLPGSRAIVLTVVLFIYSVAQSFPEMHPSFVLFFCSLGISKFKEDDRVLGDHEDTARYRAA